MACSLARLLLGAVLVLALAARQTRALYFYLQVRRVLRLQGAIARQQGKCAYSTVLSADPMLVCQAGETRCFLEELPQDTIVVGHYKAEEWAADDNRWIINDRLGIQITVDVGLLILQANFINQSN